jgi:HindIII-like restriction endonuclease
MDRIQIIAAVETATIAAHPFGALAESLANLTKSELSETLLECGIIPEMFGHDSTPEKLWAKYCDILLCAAWTALGIRSEVIRVRGNSADVRGEAEGYTIVGDAKAFRLSRTAKNQKDFKIKSLDDWRQRDTFACLVAPLYQFPGSNSQIYSQAHEKNVTLLSYIHLKFLLDFPPVQDLRPLWNVAKSLEQTDDAATYWQALDRAILQVTRQSASSLKNYKLLEVAKTREIGQEGIEYWESVKKRYHLLTREEAIANLVKAEKIDAKIVVIRRMIDREPPI